MCNLFQEAHKLLLVANMLPTFVEELDGLGLSSPVVSRAGYLVKRRITELVTYSSGAFHW